MTMNKPELEPCRCGSTTLLFEADREIDEWSVVCRECSNEGPTCFTRDGAILAWNHNETCWETRTRPPKAEAVQQKSPSVESGASVSISVEGGAGDEGLAFDDGSLIGDLRRVAKGCHDEGMDEDADTIARAIAALSRTPSPEKAEIERVWRALKERCCADADKAKRCVMVSRDDLAAALSATDKGEG